MPRFEKKATYQVGPIRAVLSMAFLISLAPMLDAKDKEIIVAGKYSDVSGMLRIRTRVLTGSGTDNSVKNVQPADVREPARTAQVNSRNSDVRQAGSMQSANPAAAVDMNPRTNIGTGQQTGGPTGTQRQSEPVAEQSQPVAQQNAQRAAREAQASATSNRPIATARANATSKATAQASTGSATASANAGHTSRNDKNSTVSNSNNRLPSKSKQLLETLCRQCKDDVVDRDTGPIAREVDCRGYGDSIDELVDNFKIETPDLSTACQRFGIGLGTALTSSFYLGPICQELSVASCKTASGGYLSAVDNYKYASRAKPEECLLGYQNVRKAVNTLVTQRASVVNECLTTAKLPYKATPNSAISCATTCCNAELNMPKVDNIPTC